MTPVPEQTPKELLHRRLSLAAAELRMAQDMAINNMHRCRSKACTSGLIFSESLICYSFNAMTCRMAATNW